ncbi:MAG: hypothetical protein ACLPIX_07505 [Rhodomicrobium sp.]
MCAKFLPRLKLFGAASILVFAASAAIAQTGPEAPAGTPPAKSDTPAAPKPAGKPAAAKTAKPKPAGPSGYATESEAKAHCRGTVVWVDSDHFNHYAGSREWGKKPGAFQCEAS